MAHWDMGQVHYDICEDAILLKIGHTWVTLVNRKPDIITYPRLNINQTTLANETHGG